MSTLFLVRHAQASFFDDEYDKLSPLGEEQARRLGQYFAERGIGFDAVFAGPARRHVRTAELAGEGIRRAGLAWNEPVVLPELHEHQADQLLKLAAEDLLQRDDHLPDLVAAYRAARERSEISRSFQKLFEAVVHLWSAGSLSLAGVEAWDDFHGRVEQGIRNITASGPRGRRVIAFTSVGPISIFLKSALAVSNRQALELGWRLRNCSITEILFTDERMTLDCFNALPHLDSSELVTFR